MTTAQYVLISRSFQTSTRTGNFGSVGDFTPPKKVVAAQEKVTEIAKEIESDKQAILVKSESSLR